jgi:hypothetical protein
MQVSSLPELVRIADRLGLVPDILVTTPGHADTLKQLA